MPCWTRTRSEQRTERRSHPFCQLARHLRGDGDRPGCTEDQLFELVVCAAVGFDTTNRLADVFGFEQLSPEGYEAGAGYLLKRGYR